MFSPSQAKVFSAIRSTYGKQVLQSVRTYIQTGTKLVRQRQQLTFNMRCKCLQLILSSLHVKALVKTPEGYKIARTTSYCFLCARIGEKIRNIKTLQHSMFFQNRQLEFELKPGCFEAVCTFLEWKESKETSECKSRLRKKISRLLNRKKSKNNTVDSKWVVNLSSKCLSTAQNTILSNGLNFAPAPRIPTNRIVAAVKKGLQSVNEEKSQRVRNKIIRLLVKAKPPPNNISFEESVAYISCLTVDIQ